MTAAKSLNAQGTLIKVGDGASPEVFHAISEVKEIGELGAVLAVLDATTLDSTAKEKKVGLADYGQLTLQLHYDPTDTNGQDILRTAVIDKQLRNFKLEITGDSTPKTFSAYVISNKSGNFAVDQIVGASVTLEISGAVAGL